MACAFGTATGCLYLDPIVLAFVVKDQKIEAFVIYPAAFVMIIFERGFRDQFTDTSNLHCFGYGLVSHLLFVSLVQQSVNVMIPQIEQACQLFFGVLHPRVELVVLCF